MSQVQTNRSQPDDYWKSKSFVRRYTVNNVAGIRDNQGAREFDALCFMAQAQGIQYLVQQPATIADFGCGHAVRGMRLGSHFNAKVTSIDYSEEFLEEARSIMNALPEDRRADLVHASVSDLPFEDDQFDVGVCYGLLMSLPDLSAAVPEMIRVVKYGIVAIEETDTAMTDDQRRVYKRVKDETFPGRIYWHNYLRYLGRYPNVIYTPLPVPESWNLGKPPGYARFIVSKGV